MATEFILPELGENIETADVVDVLVAVGDTIEVDEPVLEIETDKATFEVPSNVAGTITELRVEAGDQASVGQVVMLVEAGNSAAAEAPETPETPQAAPAAPESAAQEEPEAASPQAPALTSEAPVEARAQVNLADTSEPVAEEPSTNGTSSGTRQLVPAAPSTRRLAREIGVNIHQVKGTGPGGRIAMADVKAHAKMMLSGAAAPVTAVAPATAQARPAVVLPDFTKFGEIKREKMSNVRRATANQMLLNWSNIPQVTQFDKADITDLEALRKKLNKQSSGGAKITVTAILLKVLASALKKFPQFNASVDMENQEIIYKNYFNVGVAVDTDRGLLVPVVRDVNRKNVKELANDLNEMAEKARNRKIRPEDFQGSSMTISNLGGIGGVGFTPIVNSPEVAIMGVSRASMEPVYHEDTFYARLMMPICVSYDHRLIDGADAARFLRWVCQALENPAILAFEG